VQSPGMMTSGSLAQKVLKIALAHSGLPRETV
jgi:hypothetical protein